MIKRANKYIILLSAAVIAAVLLFVSCGTASESGNSLSLTAREEAATIILSDNNINYSGNGITVTGNTVTISDGGTYILNGVLSDGKIIVDTNKDVFIILDGVDITSARSSAMDFINVGKVVIEIADGTVNKLSDGEERVRNGDEDGDINAIIYSNADIVIRGGGKLYLSGKSRGGIHTNGSIDIYSGIFNISVRNNGISAQHRLTVYSGEIVIEQSREGMESKGELTINSGNIRITSGNDALNAGTNLVINGGYIYAETKSDGFDSNGDMTINGGEIYIFSGNKKHGVFDVSDGDKIGRFTVNGGTIIAAGGSYQAVVEQRSEQEYAWIFPQQPIESGGFARVISESGEDIVSFDFPKEFEVLFVSFEKIKSDEKYILNIYQQSD